MMQHIDMMMTMGARQGGGGQKHSRSLECRIRDRTAARGVTNCLYAAPAFRLSHLESDGRSEIDRWIDRQIDEEACVHTHTEAHMCVQNADRRRSARTRVGRPFGRGCSRIVEGLNEPKPA
eukprot:GHVU01192380.1.p3 GENE.GHVU01192380.1~~GHVU01192380.1.p3  ORF type:complete len:121 (-),score=6.69 GHVU01192380.1:738-1100(-)